MAAPAAPLTGLVPSIDEGGSVAYDGKNPNRVVPVGRLDSELWQALRTDAPIPEAVRHSPAHGTV